MEKFTPLAKIFTAAGSDGMDKRHLWPSGRLALRLQRSVRKGKVIIFCDRHTNTHRHFIMIYIIITITMVPWYHNHYNYRQHLRHQKQHRIDAWN